MRWYAKENATLVNKILTATAQGVGATIFHIHMLIWADQLTWMLNMRSQKSKTVVVKGVNQRLFFLQMETSTASMGQPIHHHGLCDWVQILQSTLTS
jgi:hypothetical protein